MTVKIIEVLAKIYEAISNNSSLNEINNELYKNNEYDTQTISAAFSIMYDKVFSKGFIEKALFDSSKKFRVLSDEEKYKLGTNNYNYILKLINIGLIEYEDFEYIIEQLLLIPKEKITYDDINFIILIYFVEINNSLTPGNRVILFSTDTIN